MKRKAEDDGEGSKKARAEAELRGAKRDSDDWEQMAKRIKEGSEKRAEERCHPGTGMDVSISEVMAVLREEGEVWENSEGEHYYDAISGELMDKDLVEAARKVEMETFKKYGVCEKRTTKECWERTGKAPIGVKRVDTNKGDAENPEYRRRLVAKEIEVR